MGNDVKEKETKSLREKLFDKLEVNNQGKVAECLGMSEATLSKILNRELKNGPQIENAEKIVMVLLKNSEESEDDIVDYVYKEIYNLDLVEKKKEERCRLKKVEIQKKEDNVEVKREISVDENKMRTGNEKNGAVFVEIEEAIKKILESTQYVIEKAKVAMEFDNAVSFKVYNKFNPQIPEIFRCEEIKKIFGIKMTEETYLKEIYNIDKLTKNKDKTFLIFCCETLEILDKILNNVKLEKGYTILLYSMNEDRKLYVKNVKKDNELLLTMVFDEDTLIFPKR